MINKVIRYIKRKLYPSKITNIKNMLLVRENEKKAEQTKNRIRKKYATTCYWW